MDLLLEATARAERNHFWFQGFRRFVAPLLAQAAGGRTGLRLLDCGCGTGINLPLLEQFGRAYGIDVTWRGLEFASARGHRRLARADAARLPFPDAQFDIVTSFDVIYSLPDEAERLAVQEMRRTLKPRGVLVLNVAALDVLRGNHSVLSREQRRYDRRSLRSLLEGAGFRVERMTYTNAALFPVVLAVRSAQRWLGLKAEAEADSEITVPPAPLNAMLSALLAVEARIVSRADLPFGSSLLCAARKT
jgi:SAM-dependent methyltransferase